MLLVEAKSTRLTQLARMGGPKLADDVQRRLGKAFKQIANTESLVRNSHTALSHIPNDHRHIGLVVTLGPYHMSNTDALRASLPDPTVVGSIRELEHLVNMVSQYGIGRLTSIVDDDDDRRQWNLDVALGPADLPKNPTLDAALNSLPVAHL